MILANRIKLENLVDTSPSEVAACDVEELSLLVQDLAEEKKQLKVLESTLSLALDLKYAGRAHDMRIKRGKDTGLTRFVDGALTVIADLPKKVKWDQTQLSLAVHTIIHDWHEDPSEYMQTEYKVSESSFNAWPKTVQKLFADARTVETGKPSYKFEKKEGAI